MSKVDCDGVGVETNSMERGGKCLPPDVGDSFLQQLTDLCCCTRKSPDSPRNQQEL